VRTWSGFDSYGFTPFTLTYSDDSCVVPHMGSWGVVYGLESKSGLEVIKLLK